MYWWVKGGGGFDWIKLRKYMVFYTIGRDLDASGKYESTGKIRDVTLWSGKSVWAFQNRSYRQVDSNPDCDIWRMKMKGGVYRCRRSGILLRSSQHMRSNFAQVESATPFFAPVNHPSNENHTGYSTHKITQVYTPNLPQKAGSNDMIAPNSHITSACWQLSGMWTSL